MSYNISRFEVRQQRHLRIPIEVLQAHINKNFQPDINIIPFVQGYRMEWHDQCFIQGRLVPGLEHLLEISEIKLQGECSGPVYNDTILPSLGKSTGHFEAAIVWEGGDSISSLAVIDGRVTEKPIDLKTIEL